MNTKIEVFTGFLSAQIGRKTKKFALLPPSKKNTYKESIEKKSSATEIVWRQRI